MEQKIKDFKERIIKKKNYGIIKIIEILKGRLERTTLFLKCYTYNFFAKSPSKEKISTKKIAIMSAITTNIGDDIQTLAQMKALEKLGYGNSNIEQGDFGDYTYIDREHLCEYQGEPVIMIMNGWYIHDINSFPPAPNIIPIFVSVHINKKLLVVKYRKYFKHHEPIGCRDNQTVELFKKYGIDAYLSKCMTSLFDRYQGERKGTLLVDVDHSLSYIPRVPHSFLDSINDKDAENMTNELVNQLADKDKSNIKARLTFTKGLLDKFRQANLVITTRLHCTLPCRALGTDVIFVHSNYKSDQRFSGLYPLLNGSDGNTAIEELDPSLDYTIIESLKKELLADIQQRITKVFNA